MCSAHSKCVSASIRMVEQGDNQQRNSWEVLVPIALPSLSTSDQVVARQRRCLGYADIHVPLPIAGTIDNTITYKSTNAARHKYLVSNNRTKLHSYNALLRDTLTQLW